MYTRVNPLHKQITQHISIKMYENLTIETNLQILYYRK